MSDKHGPLSCAACGDMECANSYARRGLRDTGGITAWLLDEAWPEYSTYLTQAQKPEDQILAPGLFGRAALSRYGWPSPVTHKATLTTVIRHAAMHRVKTRSGAVRQNTYLHHNDRIAKGLAQHLTYTANHLVLSQDYLPWLMQSGLLGGRSYDVLMTRYPLITIHEKLDRLAAQHPASQTIADYRADRALIERETHALTEARRIITPHHGIAGLFPRQVHLLDWHQPIARPFRPGTRVGFLGPAITRQGAHWARTIASALTEPLIVFGTELEGAGFWSDVRIERRILTARWLDDISTIIHPAALTNQPRRLLEAWVNGIQIYATPDSGLVTHQYRPLAQFSPR